MQNPSAYRTLAPASSTSSPSSKSSKGQAKGASSKKRTPVPIACTNCQKRKSKCSGQRPSCSSCEAKGLECHYDVKDTLPGLRNAAQELSTRVGEYERLVAVLRSCGDLAEMHRLLEAVRFSQDSGSGSGAGGKTPEVDDPLHQQQQQSILEGSAMIVSPSSSGASSLSPDGPKPLASSAFSGHWQALGRGGGGPARAGSQPLQHDGPAYQDRAAPQVSLELFGQLPMACSGLIAAYPVSAERREAATVSVPEHLIQPLWTADNSPLSSVYVEYREAARRLIANGTPAADILGPDFVSVDLFFRDRQPSDGFDVCSWACEVSKGFYMIDVKVRLALASLFTYLMRWMLDPSPESFARVPDIIRPTPNQRLVPHAPMIDLALTPPLRDALCRHFRDWASMMEKYVHFEWPFGFDDCFEFDPTTGRNTKLTPRFEQYVADMKNWSFDSAVLEEFPELLGQVNIFKQTFEVPER